MKNEVEISVSGQGWKRFRSNPVSVVSLMVIILMIFTAIAGYLLCPDKSPNANTQHLELAAKKPGFTITMLKVRRNKQIRENGFVKTMLFGQEPSMDMLPVLSYRFRGDSIVVRNYTEIPEREKTYQTFFLPDVVFALEEGAGVMINSEGYSFRDMSGRIVRISRPELENRIKNEYLVKQKFLLGTDRFGRDMLSRMILGARVSLSVGCIAVFISLVIGILLGALAGYYRGWVDDVIMWLINVIWSVPTLLLVIALTMVLGKGFWQIFIAVGISMWVEVARVVRGQVMSIREKEFIMAARALGYNDFRIMFRHILPNIFAPVIIIAAANFASAILIEAGLSFLGIGVQPPVPSWGTMVRDHYGFIIVDKAFLAFIPGFAIMILVLAFTLSGNGLRDAMDVKT